jgi:2-iminoacetate synthase ThiH
VKLPGNLKTMRNVQMLNEHTSTSIILLRLEESNDAYEKIEVIEYVLKNYTQRNISKTLYAVIIIHHTPIDKQARSFPPTPVTQLLASMNVSRK